MLSGTAPEDGKAEMRSILRRPRSGEEQLSKSGKKVILFILQHTICFSLLQVLPSGFQGGAA